MPIASFAGKEFSVSTDRIYPFSDYTLSGSLETESQEREGQKPATYIKGLGLESLSISIPLRNQKNLSIRDELESWQSIRDARIPYYFILAERPVIQNKLILKSVEISDVDIDGSGNIIKGKIQLKFEEYAAAGSAENSKSNKKRTNVNCVDSLLSDTITE